MPQGIGAGLLIIGGVFVIQGLGLARTGSFMDRQPLWAVVGAALMLAGAVLGIRNRRNRQ
ncbi:MAG TPA: LPXTG cell wall anchor domain-containing protein [Actinomycetota bacterium]|nr:LPXTG cell wall anchor domain-containing protein [Actinomycetota bacterium]